MSQVSKVSVSTPGVVAREYMEAMARKDLARAATMWAPGGSDDLVGLATLSAPNEVVAYFADVFAAVPDLRFDILSITEQDDRAVVHWRMRGRFDGIGAMMGLAPNGRQIDVQGLDLLTVRDGLIVSNTAITNALEMARQLALLPPQGSRREKVLYGLVNLTAPAAKAVRQRRSSVRRG